MTRLRLIAALNALGLIMATHAPCAALTDNPIATFYDGPEGYPAWTDSIHWDSVIDMSSYSKGKSNFEKFENARDELAAKGGGVLYYPAGTYDFSEGPFDGPKGRGLMLKKGVVIRGEAPKGKPVAAQKESLPLKTKFVFGMQKKAGHDAPRDWNLIGLMPEEGEGVSSVTGVGVAWVHIVGATVYFGPELKWGDTWATAESWKSDYAKKAWKDRVPDGTHPYDPFMGAPGPKNGGKYIGGGSRRFVFGCTLEKAAAMNDYDTCGRPESPGGFGEDGFHMAKFTARIALYGDRLLIANNWLMKSDGNFVYDQTTVRAGPGPEGGNSFRIYETRTRPVMWDYNRVTGLDINKDMLGIVRSALTDMMDRGYYEEGVVIRDNWVFNHGLKGYNISGRWMTVEDNKNDRYVIKEGKPVLGVEEGWELTLDGFIESSMGGGGMVSDNMARAFDVAGGPMWIDGNWYRNTGSFPGNDGEGILCQGHGGTHVSSWAITRNTCPEAGGNGKGYILAYRVPVHGLFIAWNDIISSLGAVRCPVESDAVYVANKAGSYKGKGHENPPEGEPEPPADVTAEKYEGDAVSIAWKDASTNEVAFRVDRKIGDGEWHVIAYRPPQIEQHPENPPKWVDFTAPPRKPLVYRVAAISKEDSDKGASEPTKPLTLE